MKKEVVLLIFICLVVLSSCTTDFSKHDIVSSDIKDLNNYVENEILVKFNEDFDLSLVPKYYEKTTSVSEKNFPRSIKSIFSKNDVKKVKRLTSSGKIVLFEIGGDVHSTLSDFKSDPNVLSVSLNYKIELFDYPNDPLFNLTWSLDNIGQDYPLGGQGIQDSDIDFPEALDLGYGDNEVIIAVIDSGVDYTHPDLVNNMWTNDAELNGIVGEDDDGNGFIDDIYGYNFLGEGDSNVTDTIGHGTHCAGIISAETNNSIGISGVCPNCKIMSLKIFPDGTYADAIKAFTYAIDNGANILSNSWGCEGGCSSSLMEDVVVDAFDDGSLVIFAAGNDNLNIGEIYYSPQSMTDDSEKIIVVAATDDSDVKASFSNYGSQIDLSAPGVNILSLRGNNTDIYCDENPWLCGNFIIDESGNVNSNGKYYVASGTSMAAPYVAGIAGLIWSHNPNHTNIQINTQLKSAVDSLKFSNPEYAEFLGSGRLNAFLGVSLSSSDHAIRIEYVEANPSKINENATIKINVSNNGYFDEVGLKINFSVNGDFIEIIELGDLNINETILSEISFNFTELYYNNLSFELLPVEGEYYLSDNYLDKQIWIYNYDSSPLNSISDNDIIDCDEQELNPILGDRTGTGIDLNNLDNITLQNCYVGGWNDGIKLSYVTNSSFSNNNFSYNDLTGLTVSIYSNNNSFFNNSFFNNNIGINLEASSSLSAPKGNWFYQNEVYFNQNDGLLLQGKIFDNRFVNNKIFLNDQRGIMGEGIRFTTFEDNLIEKNKLNGIYLSESNNISMNNNSFLNNSLYGIVFFNSSFSNISNNLFLENEYGAIRLGFDSKNNSLFNNFIRYNEYGIFLDKSIDNKLVNNTILQNGIGIYLDSFSENNTISSTISVSNLIYDLKCFGNNTLGIGNLFSSIISCPDGWPSNEDYSVYSQNSAFGCTDPEASNYNSEFIFEDGSCEYSEVEEEVEEEEGVEEPGDETSPVEEDVPLDEEIPVDLFENETIEILNLKITPVQYQITSGNELGVYINISKESEDNSISLDMGIFDEFLETEYSSVNYFFEIENNYSGISNISIPRNISYGVYILKARAYFSDNRSGVVSIVNIEVVKSSSKLVIFSITLFAILSIFVFVIYYFIYIKKK